MALATELNESKALVTELVLAAQEGDRRAFGQLCQRYERAVYNTALRRLDNHAEAQELVQEVFVQALRKLPQLREAAAFGGWLRSITTRMAINRLTRGHRAAATEPELLEATCVQTETPLDRVLTHERNRQVRAGLGRLGALDRATLVAFYVKGQTLLEMSDAFDSPVGTIKRRLHVARKRLAKELQCLAPA